MIEIKDITKTYTIDGKKIKAVDKASFSVRAGEILSVIGHSGSGKTTLLSLIGGLTKPDSGSVFINGSDIWSMNDDDLSGFRNKTISFIFQFSSLPSSARPRRVQRKTPHLRYSRMSCGKSSLRKMSARSQLRRLAKLCADVEAKLSAVILAETGKFTSRPALDLEIEAHNKFAHHRVRCARAGKVFSTRLADTFAAARVVRWWCMANPAAASRCLRW